MQIDYIAKRSLKAGHTVDTLYTINVLLNRADRTYTGVGRRNIAISGSTVTTIHRRDEFWDLTTAIISDTGTPDNDDLKEFLDSVVSGEVFQIDISGSLQNCILDQFKNPFRRIRVGFDELYRYSFRVRMV